MSDAFTLAVRPTAEDISQLAKDFSVAWSRNSDDPGMVRWIGDMLELSCGYPPRIIGICCIKGFDMSLGRITGQE